MIELEILLEKKQRLLCTAPLESVSVDLRKQDTLGEVTKNAGAQ